MSKELAKTYDPKGIEMCIRDRDSNDYMKGDFSMTKMKKICIPVLAAAALAFSVPGTTQEAEASCNTYRVNVVTGYLLSLIHI